MNPDSVSSRSGGEARRSAKGRESRQMIFALFGTALMAVAPLSGADAHGMFGGGFGGGFGHSGGGYSHGGGMGGGMGGGTGGHAYGGWGHHHSPWSTSERDPWRRSFHHEHHPAPWGDRPTRWGGMKPGRHHGHHHYPWHHPIYGGDDDAPVYAAPTASADLKAPNQGHQRHSRVVKMAQRTKTGMPAAQEQRFVPDEVLFTTNGSAQTADAIARRHNLVIMTSLPISLIGATMNRYRIPDHRSVPAVIRELEAEQQITWTQPNYMFKLEGVNRSSQSLVFSQYALAKLHLLEAHRLAEGDKTLVAIIDSGIDEKHSDLVGAIAERLDLVGGGSQAEAHGTAIASIISAHGALVGAAPHAHILAIRAFSEAKTSPGAEGTTAHIIQALNWAYERKARIVNMSFAGAQDPMLRQAIVAAHQEGMILVAAAGNDGPKAVPAYPASDPNVIAVTATDRDDKLFSAANHGTYICLAAPGTDVIVAAPSNSYQFSSGSSMAAAHISGLVALLLSEKPDLTADAARQILVETARDLGTPGRDDEFGAGLGDAERAVAAVEKLGTGQSVGKSAQLKSLQGREPRIQDANLVP